MVYYLLDSIMMDSYVNNSQENFTDSALWVFGDNFKQLHIYLSKNKFEEATTKLEEILGIFDSLVSFKLINFRLYQTQTLQ